MKRFTIFLIILTGVAAFSAAQTGNADAFRQEGIASWYGNEFNGRPTASGEIFNSDYFTAAHPSLPFGTVLTVTNTQNNRQVIVRVNDRGPFVSARIVDLSKAAAEALDMISTGTAPVILEKASNIALNAVKTFDGPVSVSELQYSIPQSSNVVQETSVPEKVKAPVQAAPAYYSVPPAAIKGAIPSTESARLYRLQVGAYKIPRNATDAFEKLKKAGLNPKYEQNGEFYRVVLAGLGASEIQSIAQKLGNAGFREALIREESGN